MEKCFETYEYLVKYNGGVENDINIEQQIVIVQENEHFGNKPADYIAEEETPKEFESIACPMFDAGQQPVYFQLNNSSELIPISVDSIPSVEPSKVFENTYVLPNLTVEVIEPENGMPHKVNEMPYAPNLKEAFESMDVDPNKLPAGYAEITVNDEQYEMLKQKGWILLETKDKVCILDSTGLHEITNDHELITKLKHENRILDKSSKPLGCSMKVEMIPENDHVNSNIVLVQSQICNTKPMEIVDGIETLHQEVVAQHITDTPMVMAVPSIPIKIQENDTLNVGNNELVEMKKKSSKIHLKTAYQLKDIPKEIVLGKTVNGKNLIARVVKGKGVFKNTAKRNKDVKPEVGRDRNINDKQFAKLVQQVLFGIAGNCQMEDIASVETVMSQMSRVPDLKLDLHKHKLIVTKTVRQENEYGLIENQSDPIVITGRFSMNGNEGGFIHIPDMLQQLKDIELERYTQNCDNENGKHETAISEDDMFLHVNITETKDINNIFRVSVMVNKRYLSLNQVYNMKTKHVNAVYACTACAKVFKSQEDLEEHQESKCSVIPVLPAHAQPYTIVKTRNKIKVYMCNECKTKFVNLKECQEHLRIHYSETDQESTIDAKDFELSERKETEVFKCKMCDNNYFHSSSLTKHILAKHIKPK